MDNKSIRKHPIRALMFGYLTLWIHSKRTLLMLLVLLAMAYITTYSYGNSLMFYGYTMHLEESLVWFLKSGFNSMGLASLTFLVAVSEIPRRIPLHQYCILRTSRNKWILSLIGYCFLMVITTVCAITICATIFLIPYTTPGSGWSDTLRVQNGMVEELAYIPAWLRNHYQPWQAILLSLWPIVLFWTVMVLSILFFSLLGYPSVGVSVYGVILFSGLIFVFENFPRFQPPMTFSTLGRIVTGYENTFQQRMLTVFLGYLGCILCQVLALILVAHRAEIPTYSIAKA